jgi:hypothetical protein
MCAPCYHEHTHHLRPTHAYRITSTRSRMRSVQPLKHMHARTQACARQQTPSSVRNGPPIPERTCPGAPSQHPCVHATVHACASARTTTPPIIRNCIAGNTRQTRADMRRWPWAQSRGLVCNAHAPPRRRTEPKLRPLRATPSLETAMWGVSKAKHIMGMGLLGKILCRIPNCAPSSKDKASRFSVSHPKRYSQPPPREGALRRWSCNEAD